MQREVVMDQAKRIKRDATRYMLQFSRLAISWMERGPYPSRYAVEAEAASCARQAAHEAFRIHPELKEGK
jgi:hypothetical protein